MTVSRSRETGALGAAIAAGTGVGMFSDYAAGVRALTAPARHYAPQAETRQYYARRMDTYRQLVQAMTPIWDKMSQN